MTLSGKVKCLDRECADLIFGRPADFKRHYNNVHLRTRIEIFCRYDGCSRSRRPANGKKGKSFQNRKDKMEEHMRNMHEGKKRRREDDVEEEKSRRGRKKR